MSPKIAQHEYRWLATYFSPDHDFVGYEGSRIIGRVTLEGRLEAEAGWHWTNMSGPDSNQYEIQQGYAASKDLAVEAVEQHDQEMIDARIKTSRQ